MQPVLAFGASSSVHSFCWLARSLRLALSMGLGILAIHFVDDFPALEFDALAEHTRVTVDAFFELLGFGIKPNELPFAADFKALGGPRAVPPVGARRDCHDAQEHP